MPSFRRRKTADSDEDEETFQEGPSSKMTPSSPSIPPFVIRATSLASLGGILFGYDMGVISGALPQLTEAFSLSTNEQQLVVGILYLGGGLGAAIGGSLCDRLGRKTAILVTDVIFFVGAAILFWATSVIHLYVGRVVMGFAISVSGVADVAYLHEMAPREWRGAIVSVNEACISLGFLLAYVAGYVLNSGDGWRYMFGVSGLVAFGQLLGMCGMPESPLWLKEQGRLEESQAALRVIYAGDECIPEESKHGSSIHSSSSSQHLVEQGQSYESLRHDSREDGDADKPRLTFWQSTCHGYHAVTSTLYRHRKQAWIALFLSVAQQLSGQANVLNYAPHIFRQFNADAALTSTLWIGITKFLVTCIVIWKIEFLGRRFLLLAGMGTIVVGLLLLTIAFVTNGSEDNMSNFLALPGVLCVVMGYSASFGPLTWLLTSELFPTDIRGRALGVSTIVTYLCAFLATSTFLSAQSWLGGHVFLLYAATMLLGIVFVYLGIPDTGGKSVAEIDDELCHMPWWRSDSYNMVDCPSSSERPTLETELT